MSIKLYMKLGNISPASYAPRSHIVAYSAESTASRRDMCRRMSLVYRNFRHVAFVSCLTPDACPGIRHAKSSWIVEGLGGDGSTG